MVAGVYREWGNVNNPLKNRSKDKQKTRIDKLQEQIRQAKKSSCEIALIGDFNICMDKTFNDVIEQEDKVIADGERTNESDTTKQEVSDYWQNIVADNGLNFKNLGQTFESSYVKNGETSKKCSGSRLLFQQQHLY